MGLVGHGTFTSLFALLVVNVSALSVQLDGITLNEKLVNSTTKNMLKKKAKQNMGNAIVQQSLYIDVSLEKYHAMLTCLIYFPRHAFSAVEYRQCGYWIW